MATLHHMSYVESDPEVDLEGRRLKRIDTFT